MSVTYRGVHWNRQKVAYDIVILFLVIAGMVAFAGTSITLYPNITVETLAIRGTAFLSLFLLHVILAIGPLARLNPHFLPLLYNRRHLGVTLFGVALAHGMLALVQFHGFGDTFPPVSVLTSYAVAFGNLWGTPAGWSELPFEPFGILALAILFVLAASSHDFWLRLFGASTWKALHTLLYIAYALVILHVAFGLLQSEESFLYPVAMLSAALLLLSLHIAAARKGRRLSTAPERGTTEDGYLAVCTLDALTPGRGTVVRLGTRRIALFLHEGRVFGLGNVCRHQGGPVGEGRIVNGCVVCPWHGWEYRPDDGESPPPFSEHLPTYPVRIEGNSVLVNAAACERGHRHEGAAVSASPADQAPVDDFYIGYRKTLPEAIRENLQTAIAVLLIACPVFMGIMAYAQAEPDRGLFEFGIARTVEGVLYTSPVPSVYVVGERLSDAPRQGYHVLLASDEKFGVPPEWSELDGKKVSLTGSVVHRREVMMLQVDRNIPPSVLGEPDADELRPDAESYGSVRVVGELVDTKCYLGTMRPATGKVHKACAIRCLSGGVPPGILVQEDNKSTVILLADNGTEPLEYEITWAGQAVEAFGTLQRRDGFSVLVADRVTLYSPPAAAAEASEPTSMN